MTVNDVLTKVEELSALQQSMRVTDLLGFLHLHTHDLLGEGAQSIVPVSEHAPYGLQI